MALDLTPTSSSADERNALDVVVLVVDDVRPRAPPVAAVVVAVAVVAARAVRASLFAPLRSRLFAVDLTAGARSRFSSASTRVIPDDDVDAETIAHELPHGDDESVDSGARRPPRLRSRSSPAREKLIEIDDDAQTDGGVGISSDDRRTVPLSARVSRRAHHAARGSLSHAPSARSRDTRRDALRARLSAAESVGFAFGQLENLQFQTHSWRECRESVDDAPQSDYGCTHNAPLLSAPARVHHPSIHPSPLASPRLASLLLLPPRLALRGWIFRSEPSPWLEQDGHHVPTRRVLFLPSRHQRAPTPERLPDEPAAAARVLRRLHRGVVRLFGQDVHLALDALYRVAVDVGAEEDVVRFEVAIFVRARADLRRDVLGAFEPDAVHELPVAVFEHADVIGFDLI